MLHAPWSADMLHEELGKGLFLVAEQDGEAVGYVGCQTVLDEGYITNVAVSPACRRQSIGLLYKNVRACRAFLCLRQRAAAGCQMRSGRREMACDFQGE